MRTVLCFDDQADTLVIRSYFGKPKATRSRRGKGRRRLALAPGPGWTRLCLTTASGGNRQRAAAEPDFEVRSRPEFHH